MFVKKTYGTYKVDKCPICADLATIKNSQGISMCKYHKEEKLNDLKCSCGDWLDIKEGKYGAFFICMNCGPINLKKGLELNGYPLTSIENL